ncbi:MAG TPA: ATPase [Thermoanaerobacterales bacterium]|nr:ATPase [Thermoanaerobacterales bacterium]
MECYKIIEQIQELISSGSKIPFSNKVVIDQTQMLDLIDELLRLLPDDLKKARRIIEERQQILIEAQREGEMVIKEAKSHIEKMVNQEEIVRLAKEKSEQILSYAKQTAREIRAGANNYADEVLGQMEQHLEKVLETVRKGREELNQKR